MIVVKIGGSAGIDLDHVCADIAALEKEDKQIVLMHGTGK
ncbi:MAG TPA: [LysW]-aminoadipate kinase, partial [Anaerolineae bacterium]